MVWCGVVGIGVGCGGVGVGVGWGALGRVGCSRVG